MISIIELFKHAPLLRRHCLCVMALAGVLFGILEWVLSYWQYQDRVASVQQCVNNYVDERYSAIGEHIWRRDRQGVEAILKSVEVGCGSPLGPGITQPLSFSWQLQLRDEGRWLQLGSGLQEWPYISDTLPISYWEGQGVGQYGIGQLNVDISMQPIYKQMVSQAWMSFILLMVALTLVSTVALYWWVRWFVEPSRALLKRVVEGELSSELLSRIEADKSELAYVWRILIKLRNDFDDERFKSAQQTKEFSEKLEKTISKLDARNQFIARLSHELRTPMNGLIGFNSLLSHSTLSVEQREYVATMQASMESMLHVINDVADLAKIEAGDLHVDHIPFNMRQVVSGVTGLFRVKANAKNLNLEARIAPDIPTNLRGDPARIRQILNNMVSNAIHCTRRGQILISVELVNAAKDVCMVRISVEDSGIALEERDRLDIPESGFDRPGVTSELRERGSISQDHCRKLIHLLGSELLVQPPAQGGEGVTSWFDLNLGFLEVPAVHPGLDSGDLDKLCAVVVDSSDLSARITMELLEQWNIRFVSEFDVLKVLDRLSDLMAEYAYVVIILDDRPIDHDGYNAIRKLKAALSDQGGVIMLSSTPQIGDAERYYLAGARGFLSKGDRDPFLREVISQIYVERAINHSPHKRLITRYSVREHEDLGSIRGDLYSLKAMVVEDNIVNQQLLVSELGKHGYYVDVATNGFEAIELFKHNQYDLILMDCMMPDMGGYETAQILREIEMARRYMLKTPIVALVENADEDEFERCQRVGMDQILSKPLKINQLELILNSQSSYEN